METLILISHTIFWNCCYWRSWKSWPNAFLQHSNSALFFASEKKREKWGLKFIRLFDMSSAQHEAASFVKNNVLISGCSTLCSFSEYRRYSYIRTQQCNMVSKNSLLHNISNHQYTASTIYCKNVLLFSWVWWQNVVPIYYFMRYFAWKFGGVFLDLPSWLEIDHLMDVPLLCHWLKFEAGSIFHRN